MVKQHNAKAIISKSVKNKEKIVTEEFNDAFEFTKFLKANQIPATVTVSGGITKNLGDYEFLRVDVSLQVPSNPTESNINEAFDYANEWVGNKVSEIMKANGAA